MFLEDALNLFEDNLDISFGVHVLILLQCVEMVDDLHGLLIIGPEPFLDALNIIVRSAAGLAPLQQSFQHHLLGAHQVQYEGGVHFLAHDFVPGVQIFQVSGEAVDEEPSALHAVLLHGALQQHDRDLAGDYLPLHDVLLDYLAVLGSWLLALCAK